MMPDGARSPLEDQPGRTDPSFLILDGWHWWPPNNAAVNHADTDRVPLLDSSLLSVARRIAFLVRRKIYFPISFSRSVGPILSADPISDLSGIGKKLYEPNFLFFLTELRKYSK